MTSTATVGRHYSSSSSSNNTGVSNHRSHSILNSNNSSHRSLYSSTSDSLRRLFSTESAAAVDSNAAAAANVPPPPARAQQERKPRKPVAAHSVQQSIGIRATTHASQLSHPDQLRLYADRLDEAIVGARNGKTHNWKLSNDLKQQIYDAIAGTRRWLDTTPTLADEPLSAFVAQRKALEEVWMPICKGQLECVGGVDGQPHFYVIRQPLEGGPYYPKKSRGRNNSQGRGPGGRRGGGGRGGQGM